MIWIKFSYLAGSTIDMSRPPSPVDLCDFLYLGIAAPICTKTEIGPSSVTNNLAQGDQVIHLKCTIRTIGLPGVNDVFPKLF